MRRYSLLPVLLAVCQWLPAQVNTVVGGNVTTVKVTDANTQSVQNGMKARTVNKKGTGIKVSPCGLVIVRCRKF